MVTFEHRPIKVKTEPIRNSHGSLPNIFQLDGQFDVISRPISSVKKKLVSDKDAHFKEVVARIKANTPRHQGTVRLHTVLPKTKRVRHEHVRKSKPAAQPSAKPASPMKPSPRKENTEKPKRRSKKLQPALYHLVMKLNGDAIRAECPYVHPALNPTKVKKMSKKNNANEKFWFDSEFYCRNLKIK